MNLIVNKTEKIKKAWEETTSSDKNEYCQWLLYDFFDLDVYQESGSLEDIQGIISAPLNRGSTCVYKQVGPIIHTMETATIILTSKITSGSVEYHRKPWMKLLMEIDHPIGMEITLNDYYVERIKNLENVIAVAVENENKYTHFTTVMIKKNLEERSKIYKVEKEMFDRFNENFTFSIQQIQDKKYLNEFLKNKVILFQKF